MTVDDALDWADNAVGKYPMLEGTATLAAEVRRLREERTRLLDEAAKRATAWWYSGDEFAKRGVDPELDRLADELRAAVRGEVEK